MAGNSNNPWSAQADPSKRYQNIVMPLNSGGDTNQAPQMSGLAAVMQQMLPQMLEAQMQMQEQQSRKRRLPQTSLKDTIRPGWNTQEQQDAALVRDKERRAAGKAEWQKKINPGREQVRQAHAQIDAGGIPVADLLMGAGQPNDPNGMGPPTPAGWKPRKDPIVVKIGLPVDEFKAKYNKPVGDPSVLPPTPQPQSQGGGGLTGMVQDLGRSIYDTGFPSAVGGGLLGLGHAINDTGLPQAINQLPGAVAGLFGDDDLGKRYGHTPEELAKLKQNARGPQVYVAKQQASLNDKMVSSHVVPGTRIPSLVDPFNSSVNPFVNSVNQAPPAPSNGLSEYVNNFAQSTSAPIPSMPDMNFDVNNPPGPRPGYVDRFGPAPTPQIPYMPEGPGLGEAYNEFFKPDYRNGKYSTTPEMPAMDQQFNNITDDVLRNNKPKAAVKKPVGKKGPTRRN